MASSAQKAWSDTRDTWLETRELRDWSTYDLYAAFLQVEVGVLALSHIID